MAAPSRTPAKAKDKAVEAKPTAKAAQKAGAKGAKPAPPGRDNPQRGARARNSRGK